MPHLKPNDRFFFAIDRADMPSHVASLAIFSKPEGASDNYVAQIFESMMRVRSVTAPFNYRLKQRFLGLGRTSLPALEEVASDQIDLDYHVRHSALPRPGRERQLGVLVSRLHSRPLDLNKPLWEMHIVEGLENDRFAIYAKIHHGIIDGMGAARRLAQTVSTDPDNQSVTPLWAAEQVSKSPRPPTSDESSVHIAKAVAGALTRTVRDALRPPDDDTAAPYATPKSVLNGRIGQQRRYATATFPLSRIKAIARAYGVTVNDVFVAMSSGALRRYLLDHDELPDQSLTAGLPVSVQSASGTGNALSMLVVKLFTDISDPAERIAAVSRATRAAKSRLAEMPTAALEHFGGLVMAPQALGLLTGAAGRGLAPFSIMLSNVPASPDPQYLSGARLEGVYPVSLLSHGQALNITAMSVSGEFCIGILGDREVLPSLQHLSVYLSDEVAVLEASAPQPK